MINCALQTKPYKYADTNFKHDAVIFKLKGSILNFNDFKSFTFYLGMQKRIQFSALVIDNIDNILFTI